MPYKDRSIQNFDVAYGLASANITSGLTIVATTGANYHGISIIGVATDFVTVTIYDNASTTSGNLIDLMQIDTNKSVWVDRYIPVVAKNGIVVDMSGTGKGAIFYGPKG